MRVKGKVYDPFPQAYDSVARTRVTLNAHVAKPVRYVPSVETNLRKLRTFKSGKRRVTF